MSSFFPTGVNKIINASSSAFALVFFAKMLGMPKALKTITIFSFVAYITNIVDSDEALGIALITGSLWGLDSFTQNNHNHD